MSFDWKSNLTLAEYLLDAPLEEQVRWRASIGRSYYGCCHRAKERTPHRNDTSSESHRVVIRYLKHHQSNRRLREIGKLLETLRDERNLADYEKDHEVNRDTARNMLKTAEEIMDFFSRN